MFSINGKSWSVRYISPHSDILKRSDGSRTVGVTDINVGVVFISDNLHGPFLRKVICHEVCHCAMASYGIDLTLEQEELICDLIATYGDEIISITDAIFGGLRLMAA